MKFVTFLSEYDSYEDSKIGQKQYEYNAEPHSQYKADTSKFMKLMVAAMVTNLCGDDINSSTTKLCEDRVYNLTLMYFEGHV